MPHLAHEAHLGRQERILGREVKTGFEYPSFAVIEENRDEHRTRGLRGRGAD